MLYDKVPSSSEVEEESAHKDIVKCKPYRVTLLPKPVADERECGKHDRLEYGYWLYNLYLLHEMYEDIGREEREQEPYWLVTPETACSPQMIP